MCLAAIDGRPNGTALLVWLGKQVRQRVLVINPPRAGLSVQEHDLRPHQRARIINPGGNQHLGFQAHNQFLDSNVVLMYDLLSKEYRKTLILFFRTILLSRHVDNRSSVTFPVME